MIIFYHIKDHTKKDQIMYMNDFPIKYKIRVRSTPTRLPLEWNVKWNKYINGLKRQMELYLNGLKDWMKRDVKLSGDPPPLPFHPTPLLTLW